MLDRQFLPWGMQEAMPNTTNSTGSSKAAAGGFARAPSPSQDGNDFPDFRHDDMGPTADAQRTVSSSSNYSAPDQEAAFNLLQEIAPNMPADQHALNDLSELHSRAASVLNGPSSIQLPSARQGPSRASSWGSSRAPSALPRSDSNVAAETDGSQLTLQGVSIA